MLAHRLARATACAIALLAPAACDKGYVPPCRVTGATPLLDAADQTILLSGESVLVRRNEATDMGLAAHTFVFDRDGNALGEVHARTADLDRAGDGTLFEGKETRVEIDRTELLQDDATLVRDRLELVVYDADGPHRTPLPIVGCDPCAVSAIGVRAIGSRLVVLWQTTDDLRSEWVAAVDAAANVLAVRKLPIADAIGLSLFRFRRSPQGDFALVHTVDEASAVHLLLLDDTLGTVRDDLAARAAVAWDVESDRLIEAIDDDGDLRVGQSALRGAATELRRYSAGLLPALVATGSDGAGVLGEADGRSYFIRIDASGKKVGADIDVGPATRGLGVPLSISPTGILLGTAPREFAWFYVGEEHVMRAQIGCDR